MKSLAIVAALLGADDEPIEAVVLHPFTIQRYTCSEHHEGELANVGDALGADCAVSGRISPDAAANPRNEDYPSWRQPVLAPFDGEVIAVHENPISNAPGVLGENPPGLVIVRRDDGVMVMLGHLREIVVSQGDRVESGQYLGRIGNNGMSTSPHVHIGAWRDDQPLQIRWDLRAMGRLRTEGWEWPEGVEP